MSRSRRKPYCSPCGLKSNKEFKRIGNGLFRSRSRNEIINEDYDSLPFKVKEVYNIYNSNTDGLDKYLSSIKYINKNDLDEFIKRITRK